MELLGSDIQVDHPEEMGGAVEEADRLRESEKGVEEDDLVEEEERKNTEKRFEKLTKIKKN